jgi:hypothetical protein
MKWFTSEQRFILSFLRYSLGYEPADNTIRMTSKSLDWEAVAVMSSHNGISSMLNDSLQRTQQLQVPKHFEDHLQKEYIANLSLSLFYEQSLKTIVQHFKQNSLTFVIHKGLGLSALLYPKLGLRPCGGDFDILVRKKDYSAAKALLEAIGYKIYDSRFEQHELTYIGEAKFIKKTNVAKLVVDLHTDFNANHWGKVSGFDMTNFWEDLLQVKYNDFFIPHLPVKASLFFLSIHCAANHIFDRLQSFCDIDLFVRKFEREIDWEYTANYAKMNGSRKTLYHPLNYCKKLLGTPVPSDFLKKIMPGSLSISLVPDRCLLLRNNKPPKYLEQYMHIILLDNTLNIFKSVIIFIRRLVGALLIKVKHGSASP